MGPLVRRRGKIILTRMGFLVCFDGFPAFHQKRRGAISLCPGELINLSLPPHERYDPDNIIIWMIFPNDMKAADQLKYFKHVITRELNPLFSRGVDGPDGPVAVKLFGAALDLKGKEKFYNTMSVQSYCGCSTCDVHFDQGPGGPVFAQARRYLPPGHPLRSQRCVFKGQEYEFPAIERRTAPTVKTSQHIFKYVTLANRLNVQHYLGHKGEPMLNTYRGMEYSRFNILEWMHNMARAYDNFMAFLTGRDANFDRRARETSKSHRVFRAIWSEQTVYLSGLRAAALGALTDDQIGRGTGPFCRRWLRLCGVRLNQNEPHGVADLRRRVTAVRNQVRNGDKIELPQQLNPLPWRLSTLARDIVNARVLRIIYPHYTPVCSIDDDSFINGAGCWRTASKLVALLVILVPALRGFVPKLRSGLRSLIWGLRILEGQTLSEHEVKTLNLERGFNSLKKTDIDKARVLIIEGLSMIEGCCPISCIVPAVHCFCHYADGAELWGLLRLLWMINFGKCMCFIYIFFTLFIISRDILKNVCREI